MSGRVRPADIPAPRFHRVGPGVGVCLDCGARVSWNALARAGHASGKAHIEAVRAKRAAKDQPTATTTTDAAGGK